MEDLGSNWHERPDDDRRGLGGGHMMESDPGVGADPDFEKKNAGSPAIPGSATMRA